MKVKEYQEAQKVKRDQEIEELVERYMHIIYFYFLQIAGISCSVLSVTFLKKRDERV